MTNTTTEKQQIKTIVDNYSTDKKEMRRQILYLLCNNKGYKSKFFFTEWFLLSFPNEELELIQIYAKEWISRFMSMSPEVYMDSDRLAMYKYLKDKIGLSNPIGFY